ncbi:hypothetical protein [Legionella cardiaca]|uniref:Transmembrane protein n=1 Tax=Legionella cardiaca TaxID=1071983 RepID=A0ABY8AYM0_9GAMM|nr:hypothetical protein [Legionella cardiaca]WED44590.1 hypothetical protein PXX05_07320 [Legionella cardiaca]
MGKQKLILFIIILAMLRLFFIFFVPPQAGLTPVDPNQIGYIGLLKNPIIQLLFCLSLIIMLFGFHLILPNFNLFIFVLIIGLVCISIGILWIHWGYIHSEFGSLMSMLMYEAYNPRSAPQLGYYQWKYSLNPAKVTVGLLILPILLPLFYFVRLIRNKKR